MIEQERAKYRKMWERPEYRVWSPGEESAAESMALFGEPGTLYDFGCGDCKAIDAFRGAGFDAQGLDLVALRHDVTKVCLWSMPDIAPRQFGFCADVMEHIPTEHVAAVLLGIAARVTDSAYFRISTIPDSMGKLIGETLHLTVKSSPWWAFQIAAVFAKVDVVHVKPDHCVLVGRHA